MDRNADQRLLKFARYLGLVESLLVRDQITIDALEKREDAEPLMTDDFPADGWEPISVSEGSMWGEKQKWTLFRAEVKIPSDWDPAHTAINLKHHERYLDHPWDDNWPAGPEGQVFIDGARVGAIDREHHFIHHPLTPGKTVEIKAVFFAGRCRVRHEVETLRAFVCDPQAVKLYHDLRVALDVIKDLDENSRARHKMIEAFDATLKVIDVRESYAQFPVPEDIRRDPRGELFRASLPEAQRAFDEGMARIQGSEEHAEVLAVGHAHIDLAWLWPISQTRHKCVRTFATQCRLLEQWPDWVFQQSSPQAYRWVQEDAPDLFERIRGFVKEGRWEAEGGMWCESDTNLPGGESLVRQFVYGKRHFKELFDVESEYLWLPDVFGYSAAMPQIMKLAGITGFITSKISWNQVNRFPHDTFNWRGTDGSAIPTHFITTPFPGATLLTYNATITPHEVKRCWEENRQRHTGIPALMSFGWGDGGGGPTEEMLETAKRLASWTPVEGMPRVKFGKARDLMREVASRAEDLPTWDGELYLEFHRGTYTTQAWLKRANRVCETKLHSLEALLTIAAQSGHTYVKTRIDKCWEDLLLVHFHDILPGSSVNEVYTDEIRPMMAAIEATLDEMTTEVTDHLIAQIDTSGTKRPMVAFNTLDHVRSDFVQGQAIPAMGWKVFDSEALPTSDAPAARADAEALAMENAHWRLRFNTAGQIAEILDKKTGRQVLAPGQTGNVWQVFEDRPLEYDAWDIDAHSAEHPLEGPSLTAMKFIEESGRAVAALTWQMPLIGDGPRSEIHQRITLFADSPRIDFETEADWHEHHQLLKVAFPVDIHAREATYQIQFGHITRPTHRSTSWDQARFECCAHRFIDLSEHGYGVALLNDCKYGHDVQDNVMRLTCIKCAQAPDARADQGEHRFTYSLLPHTGTMQSARVRQHAADLNVPVIDCTADSRSGDLPTTFSFVEVEGAVLETLKPAEDGNGFIVRLVEEDGGHGEVKVNFPSLKLRSITHVDLLERPLDEDIRLKSTDSGTTLWIKPFQIISLRVEP